MRRVKGAETLRWWKSMLEVNAEILPASWSDAIRMTALFD
jgi:hypothetical protein